jgi:ribonuclease BN (tRNA processing enzyme)
MMIMTVINALFFTLLVLFNSVILAECQSQRVKVQVLGSGGPELTDGRASSSYLIWLDGKGIGLIDAGSGSSLNYEKSKAYVNDLEFIAFTHFHVDHSADFPAFIKGAYFTHRTQNLHIFGPEGNKLMPSATDFIERLYGEEGVFPYLNNYISKEKSSHFKIKAKNLSLTKRNRLNAYQSTDYSLSTIPVHHGPLPALAWRIDLAGCSIAFSGDMSNQFKTLKVLAKGVDILIAHNAIPESQQGAGRKLHMPPSEIGKIAQQAGVKKLVLSHRMKRTLGREQETLGIIKKHYKGQIKFANDMDKF